jgi:predicted Zn finger-like uncharacterized protein
MNLTTQCPECGTAFPVSLAQLQLRKGYIRCVNCSSIFDGYEAVVPTAAGPEPTLSAAAVSTTPQPPVPPAVVPVGAVQPPSDGFHISAPSQHAGRAEPRFSLGDSQSPETDAAAHSTRSHHVAGEPVLTVRRRAGVGHDSYDDDASDSGPALYIEPRHPGDEQALPRFLRQPSHGRRRAASFMWGVLVLLGMLVAAAQLVYVYRAQLAELFPPARPFIQQFCQPLGCTVPYARRIENILIMSSSLRSGAQTLNSSAGQQATTGTSAAGSDASAGTTTLSLVLRNTHDQASEWPALVLSLTDFSGTLVARKNLPPQRYLDSTLLAAPFPPASEVEISVPLELSGLKVNGYQLDKFFQ